MRTIGRKGLFLSVSFAVILVFASFWATDCSCASDDTGQALVITDVHFNPFYDSSKFNQLVGASADKWAGIFATSSITTMSVYGSETNYPLLEATLDNAALQVPDPAFVIFPGDILGHGFNNAFYHYYGSDNPTALKSFILKTVTFFADEVYKRFPNAPVFFTLGNNDAYLGDYKLDPGGAYLKDTADTLYTKFLKGRATCTNYTYTYEAGGYFRADFSGMVVLSLNSVLFSSHRPAPVSGNAAWTQLDWFAAQLALARGAGVPVVVVTHVPPGINIYSTARSYLGADGKLSDAQLMWHEEYNERFLAIVEEYADVISMVYAGHTHMDEFRLMDGAGGVKVPVEVTSSVSPLFHNNPGYKILEPRAGGASLANYKAVTMLLQETPKIFVKSYAFQEQYKGSAPDGVGLPELYNTLYKNDTMKTAYVSHYYGDVTGYAAITETNWPVYYCGIANMRKDSMLRCVNEYVPPVPVLQLGRTEMSVRRSWRPAP